VTESTDEDLQKYKNDMIMNKATLDMLLYLQIWR